ncbi:MAG: class I SAM-dependent methyltransferase [bacterium]|nr:class I SAM-dependent methyltransferase [bacterium]
MKLRGDDKVRNLITCPVCEVQGFRIKDIDRYKIYKCKNCRMEYVEPLPTKKELDNFYSNYTDIRAEDSILKMNALRNIQALSSHGLTNENKLLDFGCGKNIFVKSGNSPHWWGYDKYAPQGPQMITDYHEKWDFITMWGILEHLSKPKETMKQLITILKEGGKLALTTVTVESTIPYQHKPLEHLMYWTRVSIEKLFELIGLKVKEYIPYWMFQKSDIYLSLVLRTVPEEIKSNIYHKLPEVVFVPTNEIFVVGEKL